MPAQNPETLPTWCALQKSRGEVLWGIPACCSTAKDAVWHLIGGCRAADGPLRWRAGEGVVRVGQPQSRTEAAPECSFQTWSTGQRHRSRWALSNVNWSFLHVTEAKTHPFHVRFFLLQWRISANVCQACQHVFTTDSSVYLQHPQNRFSLRKEGAPQNAALTNLHRPHQVDFYK